MNALHALHQSLAAVLPRHGRLPKPLRAGVVVPDRDEVDGWRALPHGEDELASAGATVADGRAAEEFYVRTWAEPSLDVNGVSGGSPMLQKTVIPAVADANLSIRLVAEQDPGEIVAAVERLLRDAAPPGADLELSVLSSAPPGRVPADAPAIELGLDAFEEVVGTRPLLIRSGGAIPLVSELAARRVPTILTGFALKESNIHSPNERIPSEHLDLGVRTATALFRRLGALG
jgi:acetylornithine deacetylase/succinyl-diaminopimelate desuccinylase-like protein